ncbi:protein kinase domain-containing protein [Pendulispora albinea]|uniref:Protein kinase n=1 Tax=Pendulispora albinea TaxID=2741071 RepID=A0ABZ2MAD5_9BACT
MARLLGVGPVSAAYEVYSGDEGRGEHAVLKLCTVEDKDAQRLFLRGVYAANRFRHPRVVPITQDGVDENGAPFVIRPWLEARSLAAVAAERTLTEHEVLRMGEQLLDALEMAHAHGITHGALTPTNLLLTPNGSVRLCDFAMTPSLSLEGPSGRASHADARDRLAEMRVSAFTAPERSSWQGARATEAGDVWSVGACMYFALCKRSPKGESANDDLLRDLPNISKATVAILHHALNPNPHDRYESAYAMLGDVRRAMSGRRPKLSFAEKPIPSGGYRSLAALTPPLGQPVDAALARIGRPSIADQEVRAIQRRGNVALVLAIVTLVGVATFVMVREKLADQHVRESPAAH